ncbi:hypothetical protein [Actinokineospora fastidiosa]|uniref:Uncharacterized protein n=1 Tax=Actinokineospora fastidiosa TaxID=1816 RepID=A0A918GCD3_9PSEU|nr:hypothetical protein [Actinokineospora fastidiosa]GGS28649.1 hypothetical protein GCM10010171_22200 [Actinokineospora fastidiosa]
MGRVVRVGRAVVGVVVGVLVGGRVDVVERGVLGVVDVVVVMVGRAPSGSSRSLVVSTAIATTNASTSPAEPATITLCCLNQAAIEITFLTEQGPLAIDPVRGSEVPSR